MIFVCSVDFSASFSEHFTPLGTRQNPWSNVAPPPCPLFLFHCLSRSRPPCPSSTGLQLLPLLCAGWWFCFPSTPPPVAVLSCYIIPTPNITLLNLFSPPPPPIPFCLGLFFKICFVIKLKNKNKELLHSISRGLISVSKRFRQLA